MQLIHKVDLNILSDDKIRLTHNDINVHIFEITVPDFIDNPESLEITMNIVDLWGNYVRINNEGLESRKVRFRLTEFFKSIGTRTCEVVFSKDNKIYHAQKFKYHVDKNLDDDCSIVETEQYPILLELLDKVKKQLEETGALNSEVKDLIDTIEDKLAKGEFDGRSVDFKIEETKVGFKYSDQEEYEWVDLETKIPAPIMQEIEKIQFKADKSYVDSQVIQLRDDLATKEELKELDIKKADKAEIPAKLSELENDSKFITQDDVVDYDDTKIKQDIEDLKETKANKSELKTKLSEFENDSEFITQDDVVDYDDSKLVSEINTLKGTKANKSEVPTKLSQLENDSKYITLQEVPKFDDSDLKSSINQLEQNKANKVHTHVSSEVKHNSTTLDKELSTINSNLKDKANKVDIPARLSQLENDKGYITEADVDLTEVDRNIKELQDNKADKVHKHSSNDISVDDKTLTETLKAINNTLDNKANNSELKTNLSEFENDSKFTTLDEVNQSDTIKNINIKVAKKVDKSEKGKADGVVPLNKDSKIALEYLPDLSKQQTNIIETVEDMQKLEKLLAGDKAFIVSSGDSYIWSGSEWKVLSKAEWENINLDWANIVNNPLTSDDLVNISEIYTKADKTDIPTKTSQLNNDNGYITMEDVPEVDLSGINKQLADLTLNKADKDALELIQATINSNKEKWSKDTVYDDTEVKALIDLKADKKSLGSGLSKKVDKVAGKQLSTNDYTTAEKDKLSKLNNYDDANIKADIAKKADTSTVNTSLAKKVDKISGKGLSTNDYTDLEKAEVAKIKNLATNETVTEIKSDVENLKTSKVDKVTGKGLSTNDYTTAEKNKLSGIQAGAQANAVTSVAGRTGAVTITKSDVGLGAVNNVAITAAQVTKINELNYTRALTQAQYDALSTAEKNRTDVWYGTYKE